MASKTTAHVHGQHNISYKVGAEEKEGKRSSWAINDAAKKAPQRVTGEERRVSGTKREAKGPWRKRGPARASQKTRRVYYPIGSWEGRNGGGEERCVKKVL